MAAESSSVATDALLVADLPEEQDFELFLLAKDDDYNEDEEDEDEDDAPETNGADEDEGDDEDDSSFPEVPMVKDQGKYTPPYTLIR